MIEAMRKLAFVGAPALLLLNACAYQTVRIASDPPQAQIIVDGSSLGAAPASARLSVDSFANVLGKEHEITAKLKGYEDEVVKLVSDSTFFSNTSPFPAVITLKLRPLSGAAPQAPAQAPSSNPAPAAAGGEKPWWGK